MYIKIVYLADRCWYLFVIEIIFIDSFLDVAAAADQSMYPPLNLKLGRKINSVQV